MWYLEMIKLVTHPNMSLFKQPNQISPQLAKNNEFSSFAKYEMRQRLGIKQAIKESDLEDFKNDGVTQLDEIKVTPTAIDVL